MNFGLEKRYKKRIDAFILQYPYVFYVYGSRAQGTEKPTSDLDLCIFSEVPLVTLGEIKEGLNNLMLPFTIDVILWNRLSNDFKAIIKDDLIAYTPDPLLGASIIELNHPTTLITTDNNDPKKQALYSSCSLLSAPRKDSSTFVLTEPMIKEHEKKIGPLAPYSWLLVMTGLGTTSSNNSSSSFILAEEAACYLLQKKIVGLGIDSTLSNSDTKSFPSYKKMLDAGISILENLLSYSGQCGNNYFLQVIPLPPSEKIAHPVKVILIQQSI